MNRQSISSRATSLDELSRGMPHKENPFALEDLRWEHFDYDKETGAVSCNRERCPLLEQCEAIIGSLEGKSVLELGPYEGYHTKALASREVSEIVAIEGNPRNYLKSLIVKDHFGLDSAVLMLGDFSKYLAERPKKFDLIFASGVLYHLFDPFGALENMVAMSDQICICTTYYHPEIQGFRFSGNTREVQFPGLNPIVLHERVNGIDTLGKKHGMETAAWMFEPQDLLRYLEYRGYKCTVLHHRENREKKDIRIQILAQREA
jgi:hypothetical protein